MRTKVALRKTDGCDQILEFLELERSELKMSTHHLNHFLMLRILRIGILHAYLVSKIVCTLHISDHAAGI
jgi:hypothetical protein